MHRTGTDDGRLTNLSILKLQTDTSTMKVKKRRARKRAWNDDGSATGYSAQFKRRRKRIGNGSVATGTGSLARTAAAP